MDCPMTQPRWSIKIIRSCASALDLSSSGRLFAYIFATVSTFAPILFERTRTVALAGTLSTYRLNTFFVDVRVDDEDVLRGPGNDGTQVAVEGVFVARVIRAFDFFFRQLELERPDQSPQQGLKFFYP